MVRLYGRWPKLTLVLQWIMFDGSIFTLYICCSKILTVLVQTMSLIKNVRSSFEKIIDASLSWKMSISTENKITIISVDEMITKWEKSRTGEDR